MSDCNISEDYRFNEDQHCNGSTCHQKQSHTVQWCGEKQDYFCECWYCYGNGLAERVNEQMQLPNELAHDASFTDDISEHAEFYPYQHCKTKTCTYGSSHTYNSCNHPQDYFCECAYCYEDGVAYHLNNLYEKYLLKKLSESMNYDAFSPNS